MFSVRRMTNRACAGCRYPCGCPTPNRVETQNGPYKKGLPANFQRGNPFLRARRRLFISAGFRDFRNLRICPCRRKLCNPKACCRRERMLIAVPEPAQFLQFPKPWHVSQGASPSPRQCAQATGLPLHAEHTPLPPQEAQASLVFSASIISSGFFGCAPASERSDAAGSSAIPSIFLKPSKRASRSFRFHNGTERA